MGNSAGGRRASRDRVSIATALSALDVRQFKAKFRNVLADDYTRRLHILLQSRAMTSIGLDDQVDVADPLSFQYV